ncbi:MAG: lipopolysaccharide heptosyltransferase II [gamma proteobacterium symbiont of Lucinoma myriamae]|nr:lipopolysaccharide heptosyltransferase II [gamma proteobacterium symbiont of Lucinoma myriamae]
MAVGQNALIAVLSIYSKSELEQANLSKKYSSEPKRCLIIGPSWVGDMVMAQSLFMVLKQQDPALQIDVMAPAWSNALLERMPEVAEILDMPLGHGQLQLKQRYQLGQSLRKKHYDQAILLPNSLKSALVPFWAAIAQRTGYVGEMRYGLLNDIRKLNKSVLTMTVQRFVALAYPKEHMLDVQFIDINNIPVPALKVNADKVSAALNKFHLTTQQPVLALCPGAEYGPAKQWPARHYAALAKEKLSQGWLVWIFGSQKDHAMGEEITQLLDQQAVNLCGQTQLAEAIDLMSVSKTVVSNDSGLMHMGAALGVPIVGVYGSSDPGFTPPLGNSSAMVSLNLDCSPCFKRVCPLGHTNCLENLTPEMVIDALADLNKDSLSQSDQDCSLPGEKE